MNSNEVGTPTFLDLTDPVFNKPVSA